MAWLFARSVTVAGIIAAALYAAIYVARDQRSTDAPPAAAPGKGIDLPTGLQLLTPLEDAAEFERVLGFAPVVPQALPEGTTTRARFDASQPDAHGARTGQLRFAGNRDASGAPPGPAVLLVESQPAHGVAAPPAALRAIKTGTFTASMSCGAVHVDAWIYFPDDADPTHTSAAARSFVSAFEAQCASR
jgi:hypothetical protein